MKIVHICTSLDGGAGLCAKRIINATKKCGIDTRVIIAYGQKQNDVDIVKPVYSWSNIWPIQKIQVILNWLGLWPNTIVIKKRIAKEKKKYRIGTFTSPITDYKYLPDHPWIQDADVIHLHWVGNFLDYESFFFNVKKPIVWTIHDQNPGLGGFHLTSWKINSPDSFKHLDDEMIKVKERAYRKAHNMILVAISTEMYVFFKKNSLLNRFPLIKIHNGIDGNDFVTLAKNRCREILAIPTTSKVFLFVSQDIHDSNKGLDILINSLNTIKIDNCILLCLGNYRTIPKASFEIRCEGFVNNNRLQSLYYSAADYFVMPSFQESFGQTPLESLACGTPVVAFPCGIIPELINRENGVICDDFTVDSLAKGINLAMKRSYDREYIRKDVLNRFSYDKIGKQYVDLYEKVAK